MRTVRSLELEAVATDNIQALLAALPEVPRTLAEAGDIRRYRKNTVLINEGDRSDVIFVLLKGRVRAFSTGLGDREITFGIDGPGHYFGEMALDGGLRSASVVTLDHCICAIVTCATVFKLVETNADIALHLIRTLIGRTRFATDSARHLALMDVYGRLAQLLESQAGPPEADGARPLPGPVTQTAIASRIGASREMVNRLMKDLQRGGYVRIEGRRKVFLLRPLPPKW